MEALFRNRVIGRYLEIGGIVLGVIVAMILIKENLLPIILLGVGAAMYFVGRYMRSL